jgi:hypothetical protein
MPVMTEARLATQAEFIKTKLVKCRQFDKYGLTLIDSNDVIIQSLGGELRNLVLSFFKGGIYAEKRCEHCGTTTAPQYERAHNKGTTRAAVALAALQRLRPSGTEQIKQSDFMRTFIEEHDTVPLWILCKACHTIYDQ